MSEEMINLEEASKRYGISRDGIYYHVRAGRLQTYKRLGDKKAYVRVSDMDALAAFKPSSGTRPKESALLPA